MCGFVRHRRMQAQAAKHHEIQPHLQRALKVGVRQPVPLADQQTLEQDQRGIAVHTIQTVRWCAWTRPASN
jgi:hypothetical protein